MADYRYCSQCGEEYEARKNNHKCEPQVLASIEMEAKADAEVRDHERDLSMSWLTENYKIGQIINASHPRDNKQEEATITTLTIDTISYPMAKHPTGVMAQFEDGTFVEIDRSYLMEDGSGM